MMSYNRVCPIIIAYIYVAGWLPACLENVAYCIRSLFLLSLIAASLSAEHIWHLLLFTQSLNHKIIDDLQCCLIHSDEFSLCPLQRYYQHAVRPSSLRLPWSLQKYFFTSFVSYISFSHRSRRCSKYKFCSGFLHASSPNQCTGVLFWEAWQVSVREQWEDSNTLIYNFVINIIIIVKETKSILVEFPDFLPLAKPLISPLLLEYFGAIMLLWCQ